MLLSMLVSFLLGLRFHRKTYVLLSAIVVAVVSFLSAGVPHYESYSYSYLPESRNVSGVVISQLLPLSFPFYAYINGTLYPGLLPSAEDVYESYQIEVLMFRFPMSSGRAVIDTCINIGAEQPTKFLYMDWGDYLLYFMFFLALNLVGAIVGYWIGRTAFVEQWLKKRSQ